MSTDSGGGEKANSEQGSIDEEIIRDFVTQLNQFEDRIDDLEAELEQKDDRISDLEETIETQEKLLEALRSRNKILVNKAFGDEWESIAGDSPSSFRSIYQRLLTVEEDLEAEKQRSAVVGSGNPSTPDERAQLLRGALFERAKRLSKQGDSVDDIKVRLNRDEADAALGGGLHRGTVLDAMKRAADGANAADRSVVDYTPINGASELEHRSAIRFTSGANRPGKNTGQQSELTMTVDDMTGAEARQDLTTETSESGGSK